MALSPLWPRPYWLSQSGPVIERTGGCEGDKWGGEEELRSYIRLGCFTLFAFVAVAHLVHCVLSLGGDGEDRPFVVLQDLKPVVDVWRMVLAGIGGKPLFSTKETGSQFGYKLLHGVGLEPEAVLHAAANALLAPCPVGCFVGKDRVVGGGS